MLFLFFLTVLRAVRLLKFSKPTVHLSYYKEALLQEIIKHKLSFLCSVYRNVSILKECSVYEQNKVQRKCCASVVHLCVCVGS